MENMEDNIVAATASPINTMFAGVGLRFEPSDAMLLGFLYARVAGKSTKSHLGDTKYLFIEECDLYGQKEPWEIWDFYSGMISNNLQRRAAPGHQDLYFFTQLKKKTSNGSRINRSIGSGTWKGEDSGKPIIYPRLFKKPMGFKKRFRYEDGVAEQVGGWIMHEYSLEPWLHNNENGFVLCRLRKNQHRQEKKRKLMMMITSS
ncbi:hypothetical protein REPUB_Repub01dG0242800 [Reevesia pubescens]